MDKRWNSVAYQVINNSLKVKSGEKVIIAMHETHTEPLLLALIEEIVKNGAIPQVQYKSEKIRYREMKFGTNELIARIPDMEQWGMDWADVYIGMRGAYNLGECWDIPLEKLALKQEADGKISRDRWNKTRWCMIRVPSLELAVEARVSYEELLDNFIEACEYVNIQKDLDWRELQNMLEKGKVIRILAPNTDLSFSVEGRKWVIFDGELNFPDGEIATAPITKTIDGYIQFDWPAVLGGQLFENLRLEWKQGVLVDAQCSNNQKFLDAILNTDDGSSLIGEFAFGLNYAVKHFCKDILLDEKIGGTVHIALGRAYKQCGGINDSAIHWDIVLDTRKDSQVLLDDAKIFENGKFI